MQDAFDGLLMPGVALQDPVQITVNLMSTDALNVMPYGPSEDSEPSPLLKSPARPLK